FNSIWTFSVQYNGAAVATVLAFSSPAITAILSRLFYGEQFSRIKVFSILLSLTGIVFVSGAYDPTAWNLNPLGIIFGMISGLAFSIYNLEGKHASDAHIDSWTALLYSFACATIFLVFFNLGNDLFITGKPPFTDMLWLKNAFLGWGLLFFLGVAPTLGGFGLYTLSLRYLSPTTSNLIATLEPAFTAIWAYFLLGEVLTGTQLFGGMLVFAGVILLRFGENKKK
ncbi:partial putative inner membrane transporter YhbE, partial [Anaerolineales bacterium]